MLRSGRGDVAELTASMLRAWPLPMPVDGDKHDRGTVLVIGGSPETPGAALLAGVAAMRAGAGRLQLLTCASAADGMALAVPEALVSGLATTATGGLDLPRAEDRVGGLAAGADAVVIGPGLVDPEAIAALLAMVFAGVRTDTVVVIDAQAIGCFSGLDQEVGEPRARLVLTPNHGEASAYVSEVDEPAVPGSHAATVAAMSGAVVTMHGDVATSDGRRWTGGPGSLGLGTSGSGDVLAGLIGGLGARCRESAQAACWGTYLHGAAGERLARRIGPIGYLARELADEAPCVLAELAP